MKCGDMLIALKLKKLYLGEGPTVTQTVGSVKAGVIMLVIAESFSSIGIEILVLASGTMGWCLLVECDPL